jgi:hypothetical protein
MGCKQQDIFDFSIRSTVDDILNGYNGTVFAYGQTGAGKSYTSYCRANLCQHHVESWHYRVHGPSQLYGNLHGKDSRFAPAAER